MSRKEFQVCGDKRWIEVCSPSLQEMTELSKEFNLNEHIVRDCMEPEHLPKYDLVDDVNFLIIRYYAPNGDERAATIQELSNKIAMFYTADFILVIHKNDVPFLHSLVQYVIAKNKCDTIEHLVIKTIWGSLETYDDPAQRLSEQVDFNENLVILHSAGKKQLEALYYIKRQASITHKILLLTLEPINHVQTVDKDDPVLQDLKDQHLKMQTLYVQILEDVNNLMNLYMSHSAQRTNDVMRVLTVFSAFFLPLTFIVGIYGMNFKYMPELTKHWGYPAVWLLMLVVTGGIFLWFKRKKWL